MKIAFSTSGTVEHEDYKSGDMLGIEYQVFGLSKEFVKRGHEVYIVRRWYDSPREEELQGIKVINVASPTLPGSTIGNAINHVIFSKYAAKEVKRIKPDILNLTAKYSSYSVCKLDIPTIYTTHMPPHYLVPKDLVSFRGALGNFHPTKWLESKIYSNCDAIVALNEEHRQYLSNRGFKAVFIPNGVEIENYTPNYSDEGYIYFTGRLFTQKGLQYLIEAYSMLSNELKDEFKLVIGGFGPERKNLEDLASKLGIKNRINFLPWIPNLEFIKRIANCSVYVMPSLFEGLPVTFLEACACGTPIITTNKGDKLDWIHDNVGYVVEYDKDQLRAAIFRVLSEEGLRRRFEEEGRRLVEKEFRWDKVVKKVEEIYEETTSN